jgi:urease accessory protein
MVRNVKTHPAQTHPCRPGDRAAFSERKPALTEGDVLYADDQTIIVVEILPCDAMVIPMVIPMGTLQSVAAACYEIGNRHLPLFIGDSELLAPFEEPLFRWLTANNYAPAREERKLIHPLRSTVSAHAHSSSSLFSKILNLTNPNP